MSTYVCVAIIIVITLMLIMLKRSWHCRCDNFKVSAPSPPTVNGTVYKLVQSIKGAISIEQSLGTDTLRLKNIITAITMLPPTKSNHIAIYYGLSGNYDSLYAAANAYLEEGQNPTYMAMGEQIIKIISNIHELGVKLELE